MDRITHNNRVISIKGIEIRLEDVPDMGYFTTDKPYPRGEICVKKPHMMTGYHNNPEATQAAFTEDGYFRTGDIGQQIEPEKYDIIARKKHIFKLAQGEFIAPESLENTYQSARFVEQIFVYGNTMKEFLLAVVVPNHDELIEWWRSNDENDKTCSFEEICMKEDTNQFLLSELYRIGLSKSLVSYEYIRGIIVEPESFTLENKLLTGPFKVNRRFCEEKYKESLEALYIEIENAKGSDEKLKARLAIIIRETISQLAGDALGTSDLSLDSNLLQFGLDSLTALKLSNQIEDTLGTRVNVSNLLSANTKLSDLANAISSNSRLSENISWEEETTLSDNIIPLALADGEVDLENCHVLLTGATGFLGTSLLESLLKQYSGMIVTCLVRKDKLSAVQAIQKAWGEALFSSLWTESRVKFIESNLSEARLGLGKEQLDTLSNDIDVILHCGAHVHSILPYSALKKTNVDATIELIKLCCKGKPKLFHFVSTAGVLHGLTTKQQELPSDATHPMIDSIGGYSQSKWVSERLLNEAHQRGLRCSISRPSRISPHSKTANWNASDYMVNYIVGLLVTTH